MTFADYQRWAVIITQIVIVSLLLMRTDWKKYLPFLWKETVESLQHKLGSFEESINATVVANENGTIAVVNSEAVQLFGWSENELKGKDLEAITPKEVQNVLIELIKTSKGKDVHKQVFLLDVKHRYGKKIPSEITLIKKNIRDNAFYIAIIRDRTHEIATIKKYQDLVDVTKFKLMIVEKGEEISCMGSWYWDLKTQKVTASKSYQKITDTNFGMYYDVNKTTMPRINKKDREKLNKCLEGAFQGIDYELNYKMIRLSDFKLLHVHSKAKVNKNSEGIPISINGSFDVIKIEDLKDFNEDE